MVTWNAQREKSHYKSFLAFTMAPGYENANATQQEKELFEHL